MYVRLYSKVPPARRVPYARTQGRTREGGPRRSARKGRVVLGRVHTATGQKAFCPTRAVLGVAARHGVVELRGSSCEQDVKDEESIHSVATNS